jgi:hypothetical protein
MDPVGLASAWLHAIHRIQSGDDLLPKISRGERTMTEIIERALRDSGLEPMEPTTSDHRVDRTA